MRYHIGRKYFAKAITQLAIVCRDRFSPLRSNSWDILFRGRALTNFAFRTAAPKEGVTMLSRSRSLGRLPRRNSSWWSPPVPT